MGSQETIAHYRLTAKLGEGGMGAVYRATDTKLNRDVAIKVLPPAFAEDASRMQRFEREAQLLAAVNHPNIAAIYGVEQGALVMELVDGADLAGPLPVDTAIAYAKQIAAALEAAHERGIVHRDLKPANIKVTPDGAVKLLDFGLAKAGESPGTGANSNSPTMSLAMTQAGMILGSAAYMAPEQARGKPVDKRADIWAFGVVLFEMLTGKALFGDGETVSDALAAVITKEPDWAALPPGTPPHLARLLRRCLTKDPKFRLRDIGEARIALDEPGEAPVSRRPARPYGWIAAGVLTFALAAALLWHRPSSGPPPLPLLRFDADAAPGAGRMLAVSPDGSRISYSVESGDLAVRILSQSDPATLPGTRAADRPVFSPDGEWILYAFGGKLQKRRLAGGPPVAVADITGSSGSSWGDDGNIVFAPGIRNPLMMVSSAGGAPRQVTKFDSGRKEVTHRSPWLMPGGKVVLYTAAAHGGGYDDAFVVATEIASGKSTLLHTGGFAPMYVPGGDGQGFLLFLQQDTLYAMPMDPVHLTVREPPVPVIQGVSTASTSGVGAVSISRSGLLAYRPGSSSVLVEIGWIDESGKVSKLPLPRAPYVVPRLSPDGKRLSYSLTTGNSRDVWVYDLVSGTPSRLTFTGAVQFGGWSHDGRHFLINANDGKGHWLRSNGSSPPNLLPVNGFQSFTPDGRRSVGIVTGTVSADLSVVSWQDPAADDPKPGPPEPWLGTPANELYPDLSRDGKWVAYQSDETGRMEIYVRPFPEPGGKWQVSTAGGTVPAWSPSRDELYYRTIEGTLHAVPYSIRGDAFVRGGERAHSQARVSNAAGFRNYAPSPDGKRIVALLEPEQPGDGSQFRIAFLVNFTTEIERRVREAK